MHAFDLLIQIYAPFRALDTDNRATVWQLFEAVVEQVEASDSDRQGPTDIDASSLPPLPPPLDEPVRRVKRRVSPVQRVGVRTLRCHLRRGRVLRGQIRRSVAASSHGECLPELVVGG